MTPAEEAEIRVRVSDLEQRAVTTGVSGDEAASLLRARDHLGALDRERAAAAAAAQAPPGVDPSAWQKLLNATAGRQPNQAEFSAARSLLRPQTPWMGGGKPRSGAY